MAYFRKLFYNYKKPLDGLIEISDRVYAFDDCFSTDVLEEDEYKVYLEGIMLQVYKQYSDASILVFNFREGERETQTTSILSHHNFTVMEYPRHYEGCPLLKFELIHHFLRSCESWLSLDQHNLLMMHCERGGWPILAFMSAALLLYLKQHTGEQKTLEMMCNLAPQGLLRLLAPLNPLSSQIRYLHYVSRSVALEWPPVEVALTFNSIVFRMIPNFDNEGGCRPIFHIYGRDPLSSSDKSTKILFTTPKTSDHVRHFRQADSDLVITHIDCLIQGDVVLECVNLDRHLKREEMMFRVMFNTAFIRSNILVLYPDQIDTLWDATNRFPMDFRVEFLFSEMNEAAPLDTVELIGIEEQQSLQFDTASTERGMFFHVDLTDNGSSNTDAKKSNENENMQWISNSTLSEKLEFSEADNYSIESNTDEVTTISPSSTSVLNKSSELTEPSESILQSVLLQSPHSTDKIFS